MAESSVAPCQLRRFESNYDEERERERGGWLKLERRASDENAYPTQTYVKAGSTVGGRERGFHFLQHYICFICWF